MADRYNIQLPLTQDDLTVLAWYAAWSDKVYNANWDLARRWPPGYRQMRDLSCPGFSDRRNTVANADHTLTAGPLLRGDTVQKRSGARKRLHNLLAWRLLEGHPSRACRLTARGRAALKMYGMDCPEMFKSPNVVFDDCDLRPRKGETCHIDFDDNVMGRLPSGYDVPHGELLPDNQTTWELMLTEYSEDSYRGKGTLRGACAGLRPVSSTGTYLNGSLRTHTSYITMEIRAENSPRAICEVAMSFEQLADLLVSNSDVPVTVTYFTDGEGMLQTHNAPPPVSVSRRMKERISRGNQDITNRVEQAITLLDAAKMGRGAKEEIRRILELVARDVPTHGAFAAQQAMEEVSSVAESMMTVMAERAAALPGGFAGNLLGGVSTTLMLEGTMEDPEDQG